MHSTLQLKSWAIQQARLDTLWIQNEDANDNITFQNVHINDPREIRYSSTILLPGGEHLVVFTSEKEFILKKIEEGNDVGHSGLLLTDVARYSPSGSGHVDHFDKVFTDTICEYPLVAYHDKGNARYATSLWVVHPGFAVLSGFDFQHHHPAPGSRLWNDLRAKEASS